VPPTGLTVASGRVVQHLAHARHQAPWAERLGQELVDPGGRGACGVGGLATRGQHDDVGLDGDRGVVAHRPGDLVSAAPGHLAVEDDDDRGVVSHARQRLLAVPGRHHGIAASGQGHVQEPQDVRLVVRDHDPCLHRCHETLAGRLLASPVDRLEGGHGHERDVVGLRPVAHPRPDLREHVVHERPGTAAVRGDQVARALLPEQVAPGAAGLDDPVRHEQQTVARAEGGPAELVLRIGEESGGQALRVELLAPPRRIARAGEGLPAVGVLEDCPCGGRSVRRRS
jgi:hypothetical protein